MILAFELAMPNAASWNGRWSGEGRCYCILKTFRGVKGGVKAQQILDNAPYHYSWSDGWGARIDVREVDGKESRKLRAKSVGFSGYDWMVDTILEFGKPMATHEVRQHLEERKNGRQNAESAANDPETT